MRFRLGCLHGNAHPLAVWPVLGELHPSGVYRYFNPSLMPIKGAEILAEVRQQSSKYSCRSPWRTGYILSDGGTSSTPGPRLASTLR